MAKKKLTFSQKVILVLLLFSIFWVTWSFVLATLGKEPVENLSIAVVTTLILGLIGYFIKSFKEKDSRNVNKIDEFGIPYSMEGESHGYNNGDTGLDTNGSGGDWTGDRDTQNQDGTEGL